MNHAVVVPESNCSHCHKKLDRVTDPLYDQVPTPGAITICMTCGHVMAFAEDMRLRELTEQEMMDIAGHKDILRIQKARRYIMGKLQ